MADRAAGDIPEVRLTLTQRLRRVEGLVHRFSEILNLLIAHGRRRNWTLSLITGVAVGFVLGLLGFIPIPEVAVDWRLPARAASEYAPALSVNAGQEVAFVFVGSSNCGWSNVPELPNMVKGLKLELRKRAENLGMSFAAVGIARDVIARNGIRHLEKFGDFDEVMSGRGWANIGVLKYVYMVISCQGQPRHRRCSSLSARWTTRPVTSRSLLSGSLHGKRGWMRLRSGCSRGRRRRC